MLLDPLFGQLFTAVELCLKKLCTPELVVLGDDRPAGSEASVGGVECLDLIGAEGKVLVEFHVLDGVVQLLGVAAEVLDPVLDLVLGTVGEVDVLQLGHVSSGDRDDNLKEAVLELGEFGLGLEPLLDEGDEEGAEEGDVVLEDVDPLVASHHDGVVAEEFLLGPPAVDVEEEGVLVEGDLGRHPQHEVPLGEGPAVDFVLGEPALDAAAEEVLKLGEVPRQVVFEGVEQLYALRADPVVRGEHVVLDHQLQEERELADQLLDLVLAVHDGDGEGVVGVGGLGLAAVEGVGEDVYEFLAAVLDDEVGAEGGPPFGGLFLGSFHG